MKKDEKVIFLNRGASSDVLSEKAFIKQCNESKLVSKVLTDLGLVLTPALLREQEILPSCGKYSSSQVMDLYRHLAPEGIARIGASKKRQRDIVSARAHQIIRFVQGIEGLERSSEVKRFLLLTLSEKFVADIQKLRSTCGIPADGFTNDAEVARWADFKKDQPQEGSAALLAYSWDGDRMADSSFQKVWMFRHEIEVLEQKYRLVISEYVSAIYVLHGMQNLELLRKYLTKQVERHRMFALTPGRVSFLSTDGWEHKDNEFTEYGHRFYAPYYPNLQNTDEFFICFRVFRSELNGDDFVQFFSGDSLKQIKKELQEFIAAPIESIGGFGQHWLFYFLKKNLQMRRTNINEFFTTARFQPVESGNSRQIVSRVERDIATAERYKQL